MICLNSQLLESFFLNNLLFSTHWMAIFSRDPILIDEFPSFQPMCWSHTRVSLISSKLKKMIKRSSNRSRPQWNDWDSLKRLFIISAGSLQGIVIARPDFNLNFLVNVAQEKFDKPLKNWIQHFSYRKLKSCFFYFEEIIFNENLPFPTHSTVQSSSAPLIVIDFSTPLFHPTVSSQTSFSE